MKKDIKIPAPGRTLTLLSLAIIVLSFGGIYQFLLPALRQSQQARAELRSVYEGAKQDADGLEKVKAALAEGKNALASRGVDASVIVQAVPLNEDMPQLYLQLQNLEGTYAKLKPKFQVGTPVAEAESGAKVPVTVLATGQYVELKELMRRLEQNIRPFVVTNLSFSQISTETVEGSAADQGTMSLNASGYFWSKKLSAAYSSK